MFDISVLYKKLLDVLPENSLDTITRVAAEYLNQHVTVLSTSYNVLSAYPRENIGDVFWDAQQTHGHVPDELMISIFENNYPDATFSGITYIDWGPIKYPRAVSTLLSDNKSLGHVSIYHTDNSLSKEEVCEACLCLDKVLRIFFLNTNSMFGSTETIMSALASKVFIGQGTSDVFHEEWKRITGTDLGGAYVIVAFSTLNIHRSLFEVIRGRITSVHQYTASAEIENFSYTLFYNIPNFTYFNTIVSRLRSFSQSQKLHCGISQMFIGLNDIQKYMFQCRKALSFGRNNELNTCLHSFNDLRFQIMLSYVKENMEQQNYLHPLLTSLINEDRENGTQYYETLVVYLENMLDSAKAADKLFIHRNTMLYRIKHIEDVYGISFKDYALMRELALSSWVCSLNEKSDVL